MHTQTFEHLTDFITALVQTNDWKAALNTAMVSLRKVFVFDNLAIYMQDPTTGLPEVAYARAMGRGKKAEADAAWGEEIAIQVLTNGERIIQDPPRTDETTDRVVQPYLLGLPIRLSGKLSGALVFVRFGGPPYLPEQVRLVSLASVQMEHFFERRQMIEKVARLESLERQMRLQEDFVATVSHDLRTPLGFIKGYTTTLLRPDTTWDQETQREFLMIIDEEADRLAALIENILESARLQSETVQMNFQPIRMDALLRDLILRATSRDKDLEIDLEIETCPPIQADSVHLAQVFENLFSNVSKYAPGAAITIQVHPAGDFLRISFADNGPGIAEEHLPYIFDRFYRISSQAGSAGTGLGLFICKQIISAHHGKIWVSSVPHQGTLFNIDLPFQQPGKPAPPQG
jgi:signal transduction histidine kinase